MTGSVHQTYQPWFQVVDGYSRVVPKSQYLTLSGRLARLYSVVAAGRDAEPAT